MIHDRKQPYNQPEQSLRTILQLLLRNVREAGRYQDGENINKEKAKKRYNQVDRHGQCGERSRGERNK